MGARLRFVSMGALVAAGCAGSRPAAEGPQAATEPAPTIERAPAQPPTVAGTSVARLELDAPDRVCPGESVTLAARAYDATGAPIATPLRWSMEPELSPIFDDGPAPTFVIGTEDALANLDRTLQVVVTAADHPEVSTRAPFSLTIACDVTHDVSGEAGDHGDPGAPGTDGEDAGAIAMEAAVLTLPGQPPLLLVISQRARAPRFGQYALGGTATPTHRLPVEATGGAGGAGGTGACGGRGGAGASVSLRVADRAVLELLDVSVAGGPGGAQGTGANGCGERGGAAGKITIAVVRPGELSLIRGWLAEHPRLTLAPPSLRPRI